MRCNHIAVFADTWQLIATTAILVRRTHHHTRTCATFVVCPSDFPRTRKYVLRWRHDRPTARSGMQAETTCKSIVTASMMLGCAFAGRVRDLREKRHASRLHGEADGESPKREALRKVCQGGRGRGTSKRTDAGSGYPCTAQQLSEPSHVM